MLRQIIYVGIIVGFVLILGSAAGARDLASSGNRPASVAAQRFPQPVRVGDLIDRDVVEPEESRILFGHVIEVVRRPSGEEAIVMKYGAIFGFGGREIAVPANAMALLGEELEVLDHTPAQLRQFPTFRPTGNDSLILRPDDVIRMGLTRPSH